MASTAAAPAAARTSASAATHNKGWIHSPAFDLALFTLAPLSGLLVVAAAQVPGGYRVGVAAMFLVAIPHYMSSFTFYLGDENIRYYRSRRWAFFVGPIAIFGIVLFLRLIGQDRPVQSTMFAWNVWHVALQSAGILAIYRRLNGGPASERGIARLAIFSVNATMAFWFIDRFAPLYELMASVHPLAPWSLRTVFLPVAVTSLGVWLYRIARRERPITPAEGAFLITSLLLFHPYLWVQDSAQATFAMLMGHFIQYLAIVWLLNHRRYAASHGSRRERLLGRMSASPATVFVTIMVVGIAFYSADKITTALGASMVYVIIWNAMTLVHFYVDGLVWAFRTPHVRHTIGPYLMPESRVVTS